MKKSIFSLVQLWKIRILLGFMVFCMPMMGFGEIVDKTKITNVQISPISGVYCGKTITITWDAPTDSTYSDYYCFIFKDDNGDGKYNGTYQVFDWDPKQIPYTLPTSSNYNSQSNTINSQVICSVTGDEKQIADIFEIKGNATRSISYSFSDDLPQGTRIGIIIASCKKESNSQAFMPTTNDRSSYLSKNYVQPLMKQKVRAKQWQVQYSNLVYTETGPNWPTTIYSTWYFAYYNYNTPSANSFILDSSPPVTSNFKVSDSVNLNDVNYVKNTLVTLNWDAFSDGAGSGLKSDTFRIQERGEQIYLLFLGYFYLWETKKNIANSTSTSLICTEGLHHFRLVGSDMVGNTIMLPIDVFVDTVAPTISVVWKPTTSSDSAYTTVPTTGVIPASRTNSDFKVSIIESDSGIDWGTCKIIQNGSERTIKNSYELAQVINFGGLKDHSLVINVNDIAGNPAQPVTVTQKIRNEEPIIQVIDSINKKIKEDKWYTNVTFQVSGKYPNSGEMKYSILEYMDGAIWKPTNGSYVFGDGKFSYTFRVGDEVGYSAGKTEIFKIDMIAPDLSFPPSYNAIKYINNTYPATLGTITVTEKGSGIASFTYKNTNVPDNQGPFGLDKDNPSVSFPVPGVGNNNFNFTIIDNVGHPTTRSVQVVYDKTAIDTKHITLTVNDFNRDLQKVESSYRGNATKLTLNVSAQGVGYAEAQSVEYTLKKTNDTVTLFSSTLTFSQNANLLRSIDLPIGISNLKDEDYTLMVKVTDQAGNETPNKTFLITIDRTVINPTKYWIVMENKETGTSFSLACPTTVVPGEAVSIYQTGSVFDSTSDELLWAGSPKTTISKEPGFFSLDSTGIGFFNLIAVDACENKDKRTITVVRPNQPATILPPAIQKIIETTDKDGIFATSFHLKVTPATTIPTFTNVTYTAQYQLIGDKEEYPNAQTITANNSSYSWSNTELQNAKAYTPGTLGTAKISVKLCAGIPATTPEYILALDRTSGVLDYQIPDTRPIFPSGVTNEWPQYLKENSNLACRAASDPDGHQIVYRLKIEADGNIWYQYESEPTTLPSNLNLASLRDFSGDPVDVDTVKQIVLHNPVTISLQAWSGEDTQWGLDAKGIPTCTSLSKTYPAGSFDFTPPELTVGFPWDYANKWQKASRFTLDAQDIKTGLSSITYSLVPITATGETDDLRPEYNELEYTDFTHESSAAITADIPFEPLLNGLYRLSVIVTDTAGNSTTSTAEARFDSIIPAISSALILNSKDASDSTYLADRNGRIRVEFTADGTGSPVSEWGFQVNTGEWKWAPWISQPVTLLPFYENTTGISLRFKVKDTAGNESEAFEGGAVKYDTSVTDFALAVQGLTKAPSGQVYASSTSSIIASIEPSGLPAMWTLIREDPENGDVKSLSKSDWDAVSALPGVWVNGGQYRIRLSVTNENGVTAEKDSASFKLDQTAPSPVHLSLIPSNDRNRTAYYQKETFIVQYTGGLDQESPVVQTVSLYQEIGGEKLVLSVVDVAGSFSTVEMNWGLNEPDWNEGGFYVQGNAVNELGVETKSEPVRVSVNGTGLTVDVPFCTDGTSSIGVSWIHEEDSGIVSYQYQLWKTGSVSDTALGSVVQTSEQQALIDLSLYSDLETGMKLYLKVRAMNSDGTEILNGCSIASTVDRSEPEVSWARIPEAVSSSNVYALFTANDAESGLKTIEWMIEKRNEIGDWIIVPMNETAWTTLANSTGEKISADISGSVTTGDVVRLTIRVENNTLRCAERCTGAIIVDDTAPPVPFILDQGTAINNEKQLLTANWRLSEIDRESGLDSYYWGWFYANDVTGPESWIVVRDKEDEKAVIDLKNVTDHNGDTVVIAVKAVNRAGLVTIGYSDGIILDKNAPFINEIEVYSDKEYQKNCIGYVAESKLSDHTVYISIQATDGESWVDGGFVQAYRVIAANKKEAVGSPVPVTGSNADGYTAEINLGSASLVGSAWLFEAYVKDDAGNISNKAISSGFIIEGTIPAVSNLAAHPDPTRVSLDWQVDSNGADRWIREYRVLAIGANGTTLRTVTTQVKSVSFEWGVGGLGLKSGDTVQLSVSAISYTNIASTPVVISLTIDMTPPAYDIDNTQIPLITGATCWYDRIEGYAVYLASRSGVSTIQWSAVLVPGEVPLVGWQEKRGVNQWNFEKLLSGITTEELSTWQEKNIRLRFRAANGIGVWSQVTTLNPIQIDTTDPEIRAISIGYPWSRESGSVGGWAVDVMDTQSGIICYQTVLLPEEIPVLEYVWPTIGFVPSAVGPGVQMSATDCRVDLFNTSEGQFIPLLRVQNGSGHWSVIAGNPITVDRTAPKITAISWTGCSTQEVAVNGTIQTTQISNGPSQAYSMTFDEESDCTVSGEGVWFPPQNPTDTEYALTTNGSIPFGTNYPGNIYSILIQAEDHAGNQLNETVYLRYNRAPQVTVRSENLTVYPGNRMPLEEFVSVNDDEGVRIGDYPLTFVWSPNTGSGNLSWTGGTTLADIFSLTNQRGAIFLQSPERAQETVWPGSLAVTDRYGKTTSLALNITVENTRIGTLAVNEYWTGNFEIRGQVTVPAGKTLTLSDSHVTARGTLDEKGFLDAGIKIESGGNLVLSNSSNGSSSIATAFSGYMWKGVSVAGTMKGSGYSVFDAERALALLPGGLIKVSDLTLSGNMTGMHLLGGTLDWNGGSAEANSEYGVKEDSTGSFKLRNVRLLDNGVDYYQKAKTGLTPAEIHSLENE